MQKAHGHAAQQSRRFALGERTGANYMQKGDHLKYSIAVKRSVGSRCTARSVYDAVERQWHLRSTPAHVPESCATPTWQFLGLASTLYVRWDHHWHTRNHMFTLRALQKHRTSSHGQATHSLEMYLSIVGSVNTGLLSLSKIYIRRAREGGHIAHTLGTKKPPKSRPHPPANSPTDLPNDTSHREDVHLCKCASSCWG